jgi:Ca-activated chloride channel family protein
MFRFANPWGLFALLLAAVPAAAALWRSRGGRQPAFVFADGRLLAAVPRSFASGLARKLPLARCLALALLAVAFARPQSGASEEEITSEGIDIVLALDVSGSMRALDFPPRDRLAVAREVVGRFIEGRRSDRLALVTFARTAATRCPLTLDTAALRTVVDAVEFAPADDDGTAIGMGLATACARLKSAHGKSRVVVLLTDGINNAGTVDPPTASEMARGLGVRVHTIGVGKSGSVPLPLADGRIIRVEMPLDEPALRDIAHRTGGEYFRAQDPDGLRRIFEKIDAMERTRVEVRTYARWGELFAPLLCAGLGMLLLEGFLASTRLRVLP